MPFDPTLPANGSAIRAAELRNQFNSLKSLIDAIPAPVAESDPVVGAISGIVKADGAGTIAAATPGTDFLAPNATADGTYAVSDVTGFTVTNGLITAVTVRPAGLLAAGFGLADYNGVYAVAADYFGCPHWANGQGKHILSRDGATLSMTDGDSGMFGMYYTTPSLNPRGVWSDIGMGMGAGTVT
jgi:hypothetical protein